MEEFETIIGLEIHVQLKTKRKMFCGCDNQSFAKATDGKLSVAKTPNSTICERCLGMPGTLPVANKEAILLTIQTGLAFGCKINPLSKFDRKHYFYPDLPKGYQISQYDQPLALGGELEIKNQKSKIKKIRLNRIHLEEDAGKLVHPAGKDYSLIDLNRAGTPLMEIVTEPDLRSPQEAKNLMKTLQIELVNQGVSDADMEKGHLRCDANISVIQKSKVKSQNDNSKVKKSEIVEIKNINSFRFVEKALVFEEKRLRDKVDSWSETQIKITRGFNSKTGETFEQRTKEKASDYRYFPEPDVPPIEASNLAQEAKSRLKESAESKIAFLMKTTGLGEDEAFRIMTDKKLASLIWANIKAPWIGSLAKLLAHNPELAEKNQALLKDYAAEIMAGKISVSFAKHKISDNQDLKSGSGEDYSQQIRETMVKLISENPGAVEKYRAGKTNLLGFFVGQVMQVFKGKAEPKLINDIVMEELNR